MNTKPSKSKIYSQSSDNGQTWNVPAKKGVGFLMIFGCFFAGLPLLVMAVMIYAHLFGTVENSTNWAILGLFLFLSMPIMIGGLFFFIGLKMRYTSYEISVNDGSVNLVKKFFKKETSENLESGEVHGVGLYSSFKTNGRSNYGLLVKARSEKDIKFSCGYNESELRWLASEMLAELAEQGGLPTEEELEKTYFSSSDGESTDDTENQFAKNGVTISFLDKANTRSGSGSDQFLIEKNGPVVAKTMIYAGLFGMLFSSVFIWVGFWADDGDLIFGLAGIFIATVSIVFFILGLSKLKTSEKFTFKADTIIKEKLRGDVSKSKTVFQKSSFTKLKVASSGKSNNDTRYSVKLRGTGGTKDLKLFNWVSQEVSEVVKLKVNAWLKPSVSPITTPEKTTFNSGYGSAMVTEATQKQIIERESLPPKIAPDEVPIYSSAMNLKDIKGGAWILRIFLMIFLCVGLGLIIFGVLSIKTAKDSETWPSVQGVILDSRIAINHGDDSTTYGADVSYRYAVEGHKYKGDKVTVSEMSTSSQTRASKIVQRYPIGKKVPVYYNPKESEDSVLETGLSDGSWLLPGIGLLFFIVPLIILIITEKSNRKENKKPKVNRNSVKSIESRYGKMG